MIAHTYPHANSYHNDRLAVLTDCYIHTSLYSLKVGEGRAERWSVTLAMGS